MTDLMSLLFAVRFMWLTVVTKLSRKVPQGSITRQVGYVAGRRALPPSGVGGSRLGLG